MSRSFNSSSINRNIVECKAGILLNLQPVQCLVLIETLWNVKMVNVHFPDMSAKVVLIETLWNVKEISDQLYEDILLY